LEDVWQFPRNKLFHKCDLVKTFASYQQEEGLIQVEILSVSQCSARLYSDVPSNNTFAVQVQLSQLTGYPTFYTSRLEIFLGFHRLQMTAIVPLLIGLYNNLTNYPISTIVVYNNYRDMEILFDLVLPPYRPFMLNGVSMNSDADAVEAFRQKNVEFIVGFTSDVSYFQPMFSYFSVYKPHGPQLELASFVNKVGKYSSD